MPRAGDTLQVYIENPPQVQGVEAQQVLRWAHAQFERIAALYNVLASGNLEVLHAPPAKPREGMVRLADGTNWNPGAGQGVYAYYGATWNKL